MTNEEIRVVIGPCCSSTDRFPASSLGLLSSLEFRHSSFELESRDFDSPKDWPECPDFWHERCSASLVQSNNQTPSKPEPTSGSVTVPHHATFNYSSYRWVVCDHR